jgi:hypothetical protein
VIKLDQYPGVAAGAGQEDSMSNVPDKTEQPTNENDEIVAPVEVPGPYPTARGNPTGKPLSAEPEPTKETRGTGSLGDLTKEASTSAVREETGGLGSTIYEEEGATKEA